MPWSRVKAIRLAQVGDALALEPLELVREVADAVGQAVGQRRLAEAAVPAARPERDGLRLEDDDPQRGIRVGQRERRPQAGEARPDDDDVARRRLRPAARSIGRGDAAQPVADGSADGDAHGDTATMPRIACPFDAGDAS